MLRQAPTARLAVRRGLSTLAQAIRPGGRRAVGVKRAQRIQELAKNTVAPPELDSQIAFEVELLIQQYDLLTEQIKRADERVAQLLDSELARRLQTIPGVGCHRQPRHVERGRPCHSQSDNYLRATKPELGAVILLSLLYALSRLLERKARQRAGLRPVPWIEIGMRVLGLAIVLAAAVAVLSAWQGVPLAGLILIGLIAIFALITTKTTFGRHMYAVGGNAEAARRAGIQVTQIRIAVFSLASMLAAMGGLLAVSRGLAASTQTGGGTLLLEAIAAAVIGGTSLFRGRGSVWGVFIGALVIGSVSNGLDLTGQPADVKYMVEMAVLLAAVTVDAVSRRNRTTAGR